MATEFETWVKGVIAKRRNELAPNFVAQLDQYLAWGDIRTTAFDIMEAVLTDDNVSDLSVQEVKLAQIYNERGWFGRQAKDYFGKLLSAKDRELVAA